MAQPLVLEELSDSPLPYRCGYGYINSTLFCKGEQLCKGERFI